MDHKDKMRALSIMFDVIYRPSNDIYRARFYDRMGTVLKQKDQRMLYITKHQDLHKETEEMELETQEIFLEGLTNQIVNTRSNKTCQVIPFGVCRNCRGHVVEPYFPCGPSKMLWVACRSNTCDFVVPTCQFCYENHDY
jgi:hypothetical protein